MLKEVLIFKEYFRLLYILVKIIFYVNVIVIINVIVNYGLIVFISFVKK